MRSNHYFKFLILAVSCGIIFNCNEETEPEENEVKFDIRLPNSGSVEIYSVDFNGNDIENLFGVNVDRACSGIPVIEETHCATKIVSFSKYIRITTFIEGHSNIAGPITRFLRLSENDRGRTIEIYYTRQFQFVAPFGVCYAASMVTPIPCDF